MAWTPMQQMAIDQRKANILVSAAAGSGKTAVLTERVMKRIIGNENEAPIEIDRFLIVTFTSAAAAEMKERITHKLGDYMNEIQLQGDLNDAKVLEQVNFLERQMALVQKASISTIHAFCLKTIRAYFNYLEIDPNIKVGNGAELEMMKLEILEELMEDYFEADDPEFLELAEVYGNVQGIAPLIKIILEVYTFSKSTPFPEVWLGEQVERLKKQYSTIGEMPWGQAIKKQMLSQINDLLVIYKEAMLLCDLPNGPMLYKPVLEADLMPLYALDESSSLEEMIGAIKAVKFAALPRKKQECDELIKERVKSYRDLVKDILKGMQADLAFIEDEKLRAQLPKLGHLMGILVKIIKDFEVRFQEAKQNAGIVDYNDLEHLCMKLLVEPVFDDEGRIVELVYTDVAKELSAYYEEVYIDEYQDSNTVQETILGAVALADKENGPTRFMVGDMKQSIYRFRLANPLIFAEKYDNWEKQDDKGSSKATELCIDLSQNFRSRQNILAASNDLFEQMMSKEVGDLVYDDYAKLRVGNLYEEGHPEEVPSGGLSDAVELHLLETNESDMDETSEDDNSVMDLKKAEWEALMVSKMIDEILQGKSNPTHVFDKEVGAYRPVEARDIVILLRATKDKAQIYENALVQRGIGAYADVSSNFFEALEVQTVLSYLKIIDNPLQDIPLITVLRSPIVGLSMDDLVYIRKSKEEGCFFEALEAYLEKDEAKDSVKVFMNDLMLYREKSAQLTSQELLDELYVQSGYYRYVTMLPTGAKKKANLELLKRYAEQYEANHNGKLFGFILYLDKLAETSEGLQEAKIIGENENLVRIMSIHKSKGLEFSVVFLCDTAKKFNNSDIMNAVLLHNELGMAPDYLDAESYVRYPSIPKLAIKNQIIAENTSEEMRVLYVALTRAKEKLYITGTVSDLEKSAKKWSLFGKRAQKAILPLGIKKAGSYLNWIGMSLFAHPDVPLIRQYAASECDYELEAESKWQMKIWHKSDLVTPVTKNDELEADRKVMLEEWDTDMVYGKYKAAIEERLAFRYSHQEAVSLPTKVSVSELKREAAEEALNELGHVEPQLITTLTSDEKPIPHFMQSEEAIKGAQRGTLIHNVFEHWDYLKITEEDEIQENIRELVAARKLSEEVLDVVYIKRLAQFAASDVVERMRHAEHVWKEKQFIYILNANEVHDDYPEDEEILVQGVVDTCLVEADGITIVDYKTDYVDLKNKAESIMQIKVRYRKQLELYGKALGGIMDKPVKEKLIYLYHINEWICVE